MAECAWCGKPLGLKYYKMERTTVIKFDDKHFSTRIESLPFCNPEHRLAWLGP